MIVTTLIVGYVLFWLIQRYVYRPRNKAALIACCMFAGAVVDVSVVSQDLLRILHAKAQARLAANGPVSR